MTINNELTGLQLFKILSDETRLKLLYLIKTKTELCVCELCYILNLAQPKVSRHLSMLRQYEMVVDRRDGKWIYYRLSENIPNWITVILNQSYKFDQKLISNLLENKELLDCS